MLHALERVPGAIVGKPAQFIPMRFISANKVRQHDRLLLAFDAFVLFEALNREIGLGKIIHGDHRVSLKVRTTELNDEVRRIIAKIWAPPACPVQRRSPAIAARSRFKSPLCRV